MAGNGQSIYMDYAATTPVDPRVVEAMMPYFTERFGNPSSIHTFGREASRAVQAARETVAGILNCKPGEIVFTSCGTESDNLALRGATLENGRRHIVTSPVEHHAVSRTAEILHAHLGYGLTVVPVDAYGMVDPADVADALRDDTALVSIMYANNEVGTIQPIAEIAAVAHARGARFHTDAVQAAGQLPLDVAALGVDMLAISAHKFYGPKGVGALYVREGVRLVPSQSGGGQEGGRRGGTTNVALIVGLAKALEIAYAEREAHVARYRQLRDRLIEGVRARVPDAQLTGHPEQRLPNSASFALRGVDGNALLMHLDLKGIAASSGSACLVGTPEPSEVLMAMGLPPAWALGGLRLTVGRHTTDAEVDAVLDVLSDAVARVRALAAA
ncbi:MAG: cysteine desulfurase [Anaerolineae bacterium]|nr:cysteine desulfurase [Anaerolineae bacterium]